MRGLSLSVAAVVGVCLLLAQPVGARPRPRPPQLDLANLRAAVKRDPRDKVSWNRLGVAYTRVEKSPLAIAAFKKAIAIDPKWWIPHDNLGRLYTLQGDFKRAIPALRMAGALSKNNIGVTERLVSVYLIQGKFRPAERAIGDALKSKPGDPVLGMLQAKLYIAEGKLEAAAIAFEKVVAHNPGYVRAYQELTLFYHAIGRHEKLPGLRQRARQHIPNSAIRHNISGIISLERGKTRRAIAHFKLALAKNPKSSITYMLLCSAYGMLRDYKTLLKISARAIAVNPMQVKAYICRANALRMLKRYEDAYHVAKRAIAINPHADLPYQQVALYWAIKGNHKRAAEYWQKAANANPRRVGWLISAGVAHRMSGNFVEALRWLRKAAALQPKSAAAHLQIALTHLEGNGDMRKAYQRLRIIRSLPQNASVRQTAQLVTLLHAHYRLYCAARQHPELKRDKKKALKFLSKYGCSSFIPREDMNDKAKKILAAALKRCD